MRVPLTTSNSSLLALAAAGMLLTAFPLAAQADVMASAVVKVTNFLIKNNATGTVLDVSNFNTLQYTTTGGYLVDLNGASQQASSNALPIDLPTACVGSGCVANNTGMAPSGYGNDNSFTKLAAPVTGNYAAADQFYAGFGISGLGPLGTNLGNASYAGLTTENGLASSDSDNNLQALFNFNLTSDTALRFDFSADAYLQAFMTDDEIVPGFATASYGMTLAIVDLDDNNKQVWSSSPDLFGNGNRTVSVNAPALAGGEAAIENTGGPVAFNSVTTVLKANKNYQLTARIETHADVKRVPEPGVLTLVGLGLLGMAATRRRKLAAD